MTVKHEGATAVPPRPRQKVIDWNMLEQTKHVNIQKGMSMASDNKDKAVLHYPGGEYEMDIVHATEGNDGVYLGKMLAETGLTTLDTGYMNTAPTKSDITFIDGDKGILQYRGYDIADLANNATFNEVSYLLINGELPNDEQKEEFNSNIRKHTLLDEDFKAQFRVFPRDAHPMSVLASSLNILSTYYQDSLDPLNKDFQKLNTYRLMAKVPMLAAYAYRASKGKPYMYPDNSLNARQNFLRQMFGYPTEAFQDDPIVTCSSCTLTTSRTAPPPPCAWLPPPRPTCSSPSLQASTPCPARCTAAPTRPFSRCSRRSRPTAATQPTS